MGLLSKLFGKKPNIPAFVGVDIDKEQEGAIDANLRNVGKAGKLARLAAEQDQEALLQVMRGGISGYDKFVGSQKNVAEDFLSGRVPGDFAAKIADKAASRGISSGTSGSGAIRNLEARDLGLTSLDLMQRGYDMAERFVNQQHRTVVPKVMQVSSMFQTPAQRLAHKTQERDTKWTRDYLAAKTAAAPDPRFSGLLNTGMQAAGMYFGHVGTMAMANAIGGRQQAAVPQVAAMPGPVAAPHGVSYPQGFGTSYSVPYSAPAMMPPNHIMAPFGTSYSQGFGSSYSVPYAAPRTNISGSATSRAFGGEMLPAGALMNQMVYGAGTPPQLDIDKAMPGFRIA